MRKSDDDKFTKRLNVPVPRRLDDAIASAAQAASRLRRLLLPSDTRSGGLILMPTISFEQAQALAPKRVTFDDLIPPSVQRRRTGQRISFEDLIPQPQPDSTILNMLAAG